jgi:hypothetical protein
VERGVTRASRITKRVQVASLALLAAILFFWPFFGSLSSLLDTEQIIGILAGVMAAVVMYFDDRISQVIRGPSGVISHGELGECVDEAFKGRKHVKRLRVMATSSEVIEALIASRSTDVGQCDLLLRRYPDSPSSYNRRVDYVIQEWRSLERGGRIGTVNIARYDSVPSEYQIIVDNDAIIFGAYAYSPHEPAEADFLPPSLMHNVSSEAGALIGRFIDAFDANHAAWAAKKDGATTP